MLQELVRNKARGIYSKAGKAVMDAAIAECSRMGLGHTAAKELLTFTMSDDPKVPAVAECHIMTQIVGALEVDLTKGENQPVEPASNAGAVAYTQEQLKVMPIDEVRAVAVGREIDTANEDGGAKTRKTLTDEILAKQ